MTARRCFVRKIAAGRVASKAGSQILDMMNEFEREHQSRLGDAAAERQATLDAAEAAAAMAARARAQTAGTIVAQQDVLTRVAQYRETVQRLRSTPGDLGFGNKAPLFLQGENKSALGAAVNAMLTRDTNEIATGTNVHYLAQSLRDFQQRHFAQIIDKLRPTMLGLKSQAEAELDALRAIFGDDRASPSGRSIAQAWDTIQKDMAGGYIDAGGALALREKYFPNPDIDPAKVKAMGGERFKDFVRSRVDRAAMTDFETGKPLTDERFEMLLNDATNGYLNDFADRAPTGEFRGQRMLANSRDFSRFFVWKDADAWTQIAEAVGSHQSVLQTMMDHITGMAQDTAMMRVFGPNPDATRRFILDLFAREPAQMAKEDATGTAKGVARSVKENRKIEGSVRAAARQFENRWAEVTGANRVPVNPTLAQGMADMRHWLTATQLGSAIISSLNDPGMAAMTARFNGIPAMNVLSRAVSMLHESGSEIFAAQQGLVADTLAHAVGQTDRALGETIRVGAAAKMSSAVIRASGLRRWTAVLRGSFGLEFMAHVARERTTEFGRLEPTFRSSLERYGIDASAWDVIRATTPAEPRPNALLLRPMDVREGGTPAHVAAAERFQRMIDTEMDFAVIENDPVARSWIIGQSQPGTISGELRRGAGMYRSFPTTVMMTHMMRAVARGWDGQRLSHSAIAFATMTVLGALSLQVKEISKGRDPLSMDPTTGIGARAWGSAVMQGGGLGVFGDLMFLDQTKFGNSWAATIAGPQAALVESVLGDFLMKNIQRGAKGEPTQFAGDALYVAGRYVPGSSLWFGRLAFQREVMDQLALMIDPRTPERFRRMEAQARKEFGQEYWWKPGRSAPSRAPELATIAGPQ